MVSNSPFLYRPINLYPTFSKILEKIILIRIYLILNKKIIIPNEQFGFRNRHSYLRQLNRLVYNNIASYLYTNEWPNFLIKIYCTPLVFSFID